MDNPTFYTVEEFEAWYVKNPMVDLEYLYRMGRRVKRCDCKDDICTGWQIEDREPIIRKHISA